MFSGLTKLCFPTGLTWRFGVGMGVPVVFSARQSSMFVQDARVSFDVALLSACVQLLTHPLSVYPVLPYSFLCLGC